MPQSVTYVPGLPVTYVLGSYPISSARLLQAVRFGDWKAVRHGPGVPLELCDISTDLAEKTNLAAARPELVARAEFLLETARTEDPN
ncbi:MAG: hypothetical protein H7067_02030 [Burkholderiales bacterium]|nr:hypothetical protein [Opitutaceae bacterium]